MGRTEVLVRRGEPPTGRLLDHHAVRVRSCLPPHDRGTPGEAGAESTEYGELPFFQSAFRDRFVQCNWYGAGGRVAVLFQIVKHLATRDL